MRRDRQWLTRALVALPLCVVGAPVNGGAEEDTFWHDWLACGLHKKTPSTFKCTEGVREDFRVRMSEHRAIEPNKCALARGHSKSSQQLRILDVGAGPLSTLGTECNGQPVELVPVDVLAPQYDATLARLHVQPRVRTRYAPMEGLATHFARGFFDLVHCTNALDHAQDPLRAVKEMVQVVKPRRSVKIITWLNESQMEKGYGMHQWDLYSDMQGHFIVAGGVGRVVHDVTAALSGLARVDVLLKEQVWRQDGISLEQCRARWLQGRQRECVMEVTITKLASAVPSQLG